MIRRRVSELLSNIDKRKSSHMGCNQVTAINTAAAANATGDAVLNGVSGRYVSLFTLRILHCVR